MKFSKHNWAMISETICPEILIFGKQASWTLLFQIILTNPIISEISFLSRHTFVLHYMQVMCITIIVIQVKSQILSHKTLSPVDSINLKHWITDRDKRLESIKYSICFALPGSMPGYIILEQQKGRSETFPCFSFKTRVKTAKSVHLMVLEI